MSKCPICNKEVENWEHPRHINSFVHQEALKGTTDIPLEEVGELVELDEDDELLFSLMTENFKLLCETKIIVGAVRVHAFSMLVNYTLQDIISKEQLKVLHRLRTTYF